MGAQQVGGPAGDACELAAGIVEALEVERDKIGPMGVWYDSHREWLEGVAEMAHLWGAPDVDSWITAAGSDREVWNAAARRQATIWTIDAAAVIGERSLSFVQAARICLDPIAAAEGAGVEPRLTPLWYSQNMPDAYRYFFGLVAESTMPQVFTELSHNGWEPQILAPAERFAWEMIPVWVWREAAGFAAKWDDMPEALKVAEPPWSDPLVLEASEWWARRRTEAYEAELEEMAGSFGRRLERLGLELTARVARCGLGPAVLERTAFTVRREGLAQEDVYDTLTKCAQVMQVALAADNGGDSRGRPAVRPAQPEQLTLTERRGSQRSNAVPLTGSGEGPSDEPVYCACRVSDPAMQRLATLARDRLRALKSSDPRSDPEPPSSPAGCTRPMSDVGRDLMDLHAEVTAAVVVNRARRAAEGHEALQIQLALEDDTGVPEDHEQVAAAMMLGVAAEVLSTTEALGLLRQALSLDRCCDAVEDLRTDLARHWDDWLW